MLTAETFVRIINDYLYSYLLIGALIGCSCYFTLRSRCLQLRLLGEMVRQLIHREACSERSHITPLQAFLVSLAGRVGTGNIAGVSLALSIGGAGAVVWMWLMALIGAATAVWEGTLAQLYKQPSQEAGYRGGPAYYMHYGLRNHRLAALFAVMSTLSLGLVCNSVHSNTVCQAFEEGFGIMPLYLGLILTLLALIIFIGGLRRIAAVSSYVVPVMAFGYMLLALYVTVTHLSLLPSVFSEMLAQAFGWRQAIGGGVAACFVQGVKRGLYSNEAGWGTAPNVAATAATSHPVKQGLIQAIGVLVDTLVVCSCTAFIVLLSGEQLSSGVGGIVLTQRALQATVGPWSVRFVSVAVLLFAFSTLLSNYYYGESNLRFLTVSKAVRRAYQIAAALMVLAGALLSFNLIWSLADLVMALMTLMNLYALARLTPRVLVLLRDYEKKRKRGENPHFRFPYISD